MSIQWQTKPILNSKEATFDFAEPVQGFFVGNAGFQVGYANTDH